MGRKRKSDCRKHRKTRVMETFGALIVAVVAEVTSVKTGHYIIKMGTFYCV